MHVRTLAEKQEPGRLFRLMLVLAGIAIGQFFLYGPSLIGRTTLLPLSILSARGCYTPRAANSVENHEVDGSVSDLVLALEPERRFAVSEFHAGRLPAWASYHFAGAPFIWPKFSPFLLVQCCSPAPIFIAWSQFLVAMIAGSGAYLFFRRVLGIWFWAATVCAWAYPLTGFFVIWQGFYAVLTVCWLPWLLLAVDETVRLGGWLAPLGLTLVTFLVVISGQLDIAGQALLASGLYALWRVLDHYSQQPMDEREHPASGRRPRFVSSQIIRAPWRARWGCVRLAAAWGLGLMLAMPYLLPVLDYTRTGARMARRGAGAEERPPVGISALPQVVLPDIYGMTRPPSLWQGGGWAQQESAATAYTGAIASLLAVPLAFCNRRLRRFNALWTLLSLLGLAWCLNVPIVVTMLRLPGLNMMSHNRMTFVACFSFLALGAAGLEMVTQDTLKWRRWMWLPLGLLAGLCGWCAYRSLRLPEPIASGIATAVEHGQNVAWIHDLNGVRRVQAWFTQYYAAAAVWCGIGVLGWILIRSRRLKQAKLMLFLGAALLAELLWFGYGRNEQADPERYYPSVPVLQSLAKAAPGRVIGFGCLPATLSAMCGLHDIRGYDAVDPARLVELVSSAAEPSSILAPYARTMVMAPKRTVTPEGNTQLPPVLDMLNVRYVIFRGVPFPKAKALFQSEDYWVLENPKALPRAFVPRRVEVITNDAVRLQKIESDDFNPREVAFVESAVKLPNSIEGTAEITDEIPTRVTVAVDMKTPGMVVLADLWDKGWSAYLNGSPVPILRANHAVRGVVVGPGKQMLQFRYVPAGFALGLKLAAAAATIIVILLIAGLRQFLAPRLQNGLGSTPPGGLSSTTWSPSTPGSRDGGTET